MTIQTQLEYLKTILDKKISYLNKSTFTIELTIATAKKGVTITNQIEAIHKFQSLFEISIMEQNPKRTLHYLICTEKAIEKLIGNVEETIGEFQKEIIT